MTPVDFPEANSKFGPPPGYTEEQVGSIPTFVGKINGGANDGDACVIAAWKPNDEEIADIVAGKPIYLVMLGGLMPHLLTTTEHKYMAKE